MIKKYIVSILLLLVIGNTCAHTMSGVLPKTSGVYAADIYQYTCYVDPNLNGGAPADKLKITISSGAVRMSISGPAGGVSSTSSVGGIIEQNASIGALNGNIFWQLVEPISPIVAVITYGASDFCLANNGTNGLAILQRQNDRLADASVSTTTSLPGKVDVTVTSASANTSSNSYLKSHVWRSTSSAGPYVKLGSLSAASGVFSDSTASPGVTYYYKATTTFNPAATNNLPINEDIVPELAAAGGRTLVAPVVGMAAAAITVPSGLTASTTSLDQVDLTWTAVSGASYKVYRATSSTGPFTTPIASPAGTSFADTTTVNGTSYWYAVSAVTNGNEGAKSSAVTGQSVGLPATPVGLTASTTTLDQVNLTWGAVSGASYKVYRGASSTGPFSLLTSPAGTSFADTTSVNGTSYWYTVSAVTNGNEGSKSAAVTGQSVALPAIPSGLTASTTSLDQVDLAWDVITGASYKVYRGTSPTGPFSLLTSPTGTSFADTTSVNGTSFADTTSVNGTSYWYTVSAVTNGNEGAQSVAVTGESIGLPATPAGLTASTNQVDKIDLSWTAVAGAQYLIYRADTSTGPFNVLGSVTTENYSDTSITSGIAYWYTVSAIAYGNEGAQSSPASGQALAMPAIPDGLTATQGTVIDRVSLTWTAVSTVTGYGIYRDGAQVGVTSDLFYDDVLIGDILVHNYTISALASGLESAQSEWVSGFAKAQSTGGVVDGTTPPPATSHYKIVVKTPLH